MTWLPSSTPIPMRDTTPIAMTDAPMHDEDTLIDNETGSSSAVPRLANLPVLVTSAPIGRKFERPNVSNDQPTEFSFSKPDHVNMDMRAGVARNQEANASGI